jgi:hypothetical protein
MTARKVCKEHLSLVERIARIEGKLSILIALNLATIGLIATLLAAILRR